MEIIVTVVFGFGGGAFIIYMGLSHLLSAINEKMKCKEKVVGKIVDVERRSFRSFVGYYPIVEFHGHGKDVRKKANCSSRLKSTYKPGNDIEILYNSENPEQFVIKGKSFVYNIVTGIEFFVLGAFIIIGAYLSIKG